MKMFSVMVFWTKIQFKFKIQFLLWKLHKLQYQKEEGGGGGKHTKKILTPF